MDPISAIFVMTVLGGLFVKGVDVATDGWFSAEVGAGVRGAGSYAWRAERARWGRAREKAREIRQQTPQGQAVQEILDLAGLFGRTLFGELRQFGSGVRSEWRTARDQARSVRTGRRGDDPWPVTTWLRERAERVRSGLAERGERARTAAPNEPAQDPSGEPERGAERPAWIIVGKTYSHCSECLANVVDYTEAETCSGCEARFVGIRVVYPEHLDDVRAERPDLPVNVDGDLGSPTAQCPDCGLPIVISTLNDHRRGLDRCPFADDPNDPNGDPNVPLPSTVPDANGDVQCGCCAQSHKPLPPGEHCPHCHIHDQPTPPNQPAQSGPTKGTATVADINSAPAAIAAAEAFAPRFESLQSRADDLAGEWDSLKNDADALHGEIATLMDGMGDFAIGGEADTAAVVGELSESATSAKEQADNVVGSISTAKEAHAAYVDNLHLEYDASIEAAAGKAPAAHAVMQEA